MCAEKVRPGSVHPFRGKRAIAATFGIWAKKKAKWIEIHITGDGVNFTQTWVTNNPKSQRYHRTLFRDLRQLLIAYDKWTLGEDGAETK
ncbi:MAG: hypothetical protein PHR43_02770 [Dehalococcoidales bacterium]|nr:hypothetical protein [Dehalococcoidales bacterium]